jgi:hypothetical protein
VKDNWLDMKDHSLTDKDYNAMYDDDTGIHEVAPVSGSTVQTPS